MKYSISYFIEKALRVDIVDSRDMEVLESKLRGIHLELPEVNLENTMEVITSMVVSLYRKIYRERLVLSAIERASLCTGSIMEPSPDFKEILVLDEDFDSIMFYFENHYKVLGENMVGLCSGNGTETIMVKIRKR